jgi:hypothetical protein
VHEVATRRFYLHKLPADSVLNRKTFSNIEHRLSEAGPYVTAAERETQWTVRQPELQIRIMDDVANILRPASGGSQVQNILPFLLWRVLREKRCTAFSVAKVLRPKLTLIKWCFVNGPHHSVILFFSPSCSSQTPQKI